MYRTALLTVLAPISWGTTYVTITELAPAGRPLLVAALRVLPAALVLLLVGTLWQPWRPHGSDWWRTAALSVCNFTAFFPLLIVAVYRLPGGVAAAAGGLQPLLVAGLSVPLGNRRPTAGELAVGAIAAVGVAMVVVRPGADVDPLGVAAAVGANVSFAAGVVLTKRWPSPSRRLAATGWQLLFGGALLVPLAAAIEGTPPGLTATNVAGLGYLTLVATAARLRRVVQRDRTPACSSPAAPRARRTRDRRRAWLAPPRAVPLSGTTFRLRRHARNHRLCRPFGGRADTPAFSVTDGWSKAVARSDPRWVRCPQVNELTAKSRSGRWENGDCC